MLNRPSGLMIQSRFVFYFAGGCLLFSHCYMQNKISLLTEGEHVSLSQKPRLFLRAGFKQDKHITLHHGYCKNHTDRNEMNIRTTLKRFQC